jgi:hypothetical protein
MLKKLAFGALIGASAFAWTINGTGSSFQYPVNKAWIKGFYSETSNRVNYTATGSGTGITHGLRELVPHVSSQLDESLSEGYTVGVLVPQLGQYFHYKGRIFEGVNPVPPFLNLHLRPPQ